MKINFKKFRFYPTIKKDVVVEKDVAFDIANAIYTQCQGIAAHSLAMKIYNAEGEIGLNDAEYDLLKRYAESFGTPMLIEAINSLKDD